MNTLRERLAEMQRVHCIEEVTAFRVIFENGDTVLIESQDDVALDRTDPIRSAKMISSADASVPVLQLNNGVTLEICLREQHQRPHVHAAYGGERHVASFSIEEGERIKPKSLAHKYGTHDKAIRSDILTHKDKLLAIWREIRLGKDPKPLIEELRRAN